MNPIDVEEARRYTECSDCEQGLYVYDSRGYPEDTGAICFDCLAKRYAKLRDAAKSEPPALVWSSERPKVEGWYWVRRKDSGNQPKTVWIDELDVREDADAEFVRVFFGPREFAGPIPKPKEAQL